jgi:hypothetical protein
VTFLKLGEGGAVSCPHKLLHFLPLALSGLAVARSRLLYLLVQDRELVFLPTLP